MLLTLSLRAGRAYSLAWHLTANLHAFAVFIDAHAQIYRLFTAELVFDEQRLIYARSVLEEVRLNNLLPVPRPLSLSVLMSLSSDDMFGRSPVLFASTISCLFVVQY